MPPPLSGGSYKNGGVYKRIPIPLYTVYIIDPDLTNKKYFDKRFLKISGKIWDIRNIFVIRFLGFEICTGKYHGRRIFVKSPAKIFIF